MDELHIRLAEELLFSDKKIHPSFVKLLYFGIYDETQVLPYPPITEEQRKEVEAFVERVNQFADKEIDPDQIDRQPAIPDEVIKGLGNLGVLGMTVPKEYGGQGMSQYAYCKTTEAIARRCGSTALFVNAHQSIGLKALLLFGTPEQKEKWLSPLAKGEQIAAFALTEPNAGSDASGLETRAVYDAEKNIYRINGRKQWITNGSIAKILTVMAKTEVDTPQGKQDKITAFLVTPDMPGFIVTAYALDKVGMRGSKTANLEFRNLEVPAANILGPIGGGLKVCLTVLDYGRTTFGATCTGAAKFALEMAIQHAKERYQFHRPLGSFALVKKKIAKMAALVYAMDATTYLTASFVDAKVEEFMLESAILKVFCSESLWTIIYETMQIYGGRSFFTDTPLERMMRDARLNMIGEGSNEVLKAFIGVVGMRDVGVQLKSVLDAFKEPFQHFNLLSRFSLQSLKKMAAPRIPIHSEHLKSEGAELGKAVRRFGFSVTKALAAYRENIVEKQLVLERIANSAIAIYTMTAVLSKLDTDLAAGKPDALKHDLPIGKYYCRMALQSIDHNLSTLFSDNDPLIENVSDLLTEIPKTF